MKEQWLNQAANPEIAARKEVTVSAAVFAHFKQISARTVGKEIFDSIRVALGVLESKFEGNANALHLVTSTTLDLVNMETGQRGFLLTGKDASLEPYINGNKSLKDNLNRLRAIAADAGVDKNDIQSLKRLVSSCK